MQQWIMGSDYDDFDVGNLSLIPAPEFNWSAFDYPDLELPLRWQGGLIFLYSSTALLTLVGNIVVLIVLTKGNRSRTQLSRYLINMAISDLCMAVFCIPFTYTKTMLGRWVFGEVMCPLVLFSQVLSVAVSIYTNTAIGIDRWVQLFSTPSDAIALSSQIARFMGPTWGHLGPTAPRWAPFDPMNFVIWDTKEVDPNLVKPPMNFNGGLAKVVLTS